MESFEPGIINGKPWTGREGLSSYYGQSQLRTAVGDPPKGKYKNKQQDLSVETEKFCKNGCGRPAYRLKRYCDFCRKLKDAECSRRGNKRRKAKLVIE